MNPKNAPPATPRAADTKPAAGATAADDAAAPETAPTDSGVARITAERTRQIEHEGYSAEHDDAHATGQLTLAACCYAHHAVEQQRGRDAAIPTNWPWHQGEWNPAPDPLRNLEIAGALIAAEIDRILRTREATPERTAA